MINSDVNSIFFVASSLNGKVAHWLVSYKNGSHKEFGIDDSRVNGLLKKAEGKSRKQMKELGF